MSHTPRLQIRGGHTLSGSITASGAKNAVLPILCASLLASAPVTISNVPHLQDVTTCLALLRSLGASVTQQEDTVTIDPRGVNNIRASYELVSLMRASILVLGPLLARCGEAEVSLPGGCAIGSRPIDQHLKGLRALGARIELENGYVHAQAPAGRLVGGHVVFDMITVTGVENILMAAVLAEGKTILENCAREPEVTDLAHMLVALGAQISGIGSDTLIIEGVPHLQGGHYRVMPDRIEIGTYLAAAAMTGGDVCVTAVNPRHQDATLIKLRDMGCLITEGNDWLRLQRHTPRLQAVNLRTAPYPAFATDMQAQFVALNTVAEGVATVTETIFENRFMHINELARMGAAVQIQGNTAIITGVQQLTGVHVTATDLRASACLVIAGLGAQGETVIDHIYHLDRGYASMESKLAALGAQIVRI